MSKWIFILSDILLNRVQLDAILLNEILFRVILINVILINIIMPNDILMNPMFDYCSVECHLWLTAILSNGILFKCILLNIRFWMSFWLSFCWTSFLSVIPLNVIHLKTLAPSGIVLNIMHIMLFCWMAFITSVKCHSAACSFGESYYAERNIVDFHYF